METSGKPGAKFPNLSKNCVFSCLLTIDLCYTQLRIMSFAPHSVLLPLHLHPAGIPSVPFRTVN